MTSANVPCGIGSQRDTALRAAARGGRREHPWDFLLSVKQEHRRLPMGDGVQHLDIQKGRFCSTDQGRVVPFDPALGIAGLVAAVGEDSGGYVVSVIVRAAIETVIEGMSSARLGQKVYARPNRDRMTEVFTMADTGVPFGELLIVTDHEKNRGLIGFKPASDARSFELAQSSRGLGEKWLRG